MNRSIAFCFGALFLAAAGLGYLDWAWLGFLMAISQPSNGRPASCASGIRPTTA